jgi:hypothetical protein
MRTRKDTTKLPGTYYFNRIKFEDGGGDSNSESDLIDADSKGVIHNQEENIHWKIRGVVYSREREYDVNEEIEIPYSACRKQGLPLEISVSIKGKGKRI